MCGLLERCGELPVGEAGLAEFAEGLVERRFGIWEFDDLPELEECRVCVECFADRVDELEPRTEVLVERRARDPSPDGDVFDCGGVEGPFGEQLAYRALDPLAGRLRAAQLSGGAIGVSRHEQSV